MGVEGEFAVRKLAGATLINTSVRRPLNQRQRRFRVRIHRAQQHPRWSVRPAGMLLPAAQRGDRHTQFGGSVGPTASLRLHVAELDLGA